MTLVDTNVLFDLATDDAQWFEWSASALEAAAAEGPIYINAIVYAELSARYDKSSDVDNFIEIAGVELIDLSRRATFLAAKAFGEYRTKGGMKTGVLSDFFIGAHAAALNIPLLTRDVRRYRTYFPDVRLIAP